MPFPPKKFAKKPTPGAVPPKPGAVPTKPGAVPTKPGAVAPGTDPAQTPPQEGAMGEQAAGPTAKFPGGETPKAEFPGVGNPKATGAPKGKVPPSQASMTKAEAQAPAAGADTLTQLMDIVEGLAQIMASARSPIAGPGQPVTPGATPAPATPGTNPDAPADAPAGEKGMPRLSPDQIGAVLGIVEIANQGRVPRAGAAVLISSGFGFDRKAALALVTPDARAPVAPGEEVEGEEVEGEEVEGEEVEGEEVEEEGDEGEERDISDWGGEPGETAKTEMQSGPGPLKPELSAAPVRPIQPEKPAPDPEDDDRWDAITDVTEVLAKLEARREVLNIRLDTLVKSRDLVAETVAEWLDD